MKIIKLTKGKQAIVDDEHYDLLNQWKWCYNGDYAYRQENNKGILMHRFLLNAKKGEFCDHINRDKLDNRKLNIRICSKAENQQNQPVRSDSSTGYKGVTPWPRGKVRRWKAYIGINNRVNSLGYYETKEEAAYVYDQAALQLYGDYASLNLINK